MLTSTKQKSEYCAVIMYKWSLKLIEINVKRNLLCFKGLRVPVNTVHFINCLRQIERVCMQQLDCVCSSAFAVHKEPKLTPTGYIKIDLCQ